MDSCRSCRFASIIAQQCRAEAPKVFPVPTNKGLVPFSVFPSLPPDGSGCGAHSPADDAEMERREREHPVTEREVAPSGPRLVAP